MVEHGEYFSLELRNSKTLASGVLNFRCLEGGLTCSEGMSSCLRSLISKDSPLKN